MDTVFPLTETIVAMRKDCLSMWKREGGGGIRMENLEGGREGTGGSLGGELILQQSGRKRGRGRVLMRPNESHVDDSYAIIFSD